MIRAIGLYELMHTIPSGEYIKKKVDVIYPLGSIGTSPPKLLTSGDSEKTTS